MTQTHLPMAPHKFITIFILGFLFFSNCVDSAKICNMTVETSDECDRTCYQYCKSIRPNSAATCELRGGLDSFVCCCDYFKPPIL
ncbi:hypothetical protein Lalb_Chr22g0358601 [Lupinus albus]|uniref:Knottin, scorpion toxin n=1 Tax=Lupinus albus TaxID=3870 RepID=A0A6A4NGZ1_LUPAL|nr:hypothetical protein Lalb_Chr22g0358601 [Lupinus albus]